MKHRSLFAAGFVAVLLTLSASVAFSKPKGEEKTVKGEVVDLWCYLNDGSHGAGHKGCAVTCAKAGNPIGILDAKGNVYVVLGGDAHKPNLDALIDKMAETVTVTGKVVTKGGTQVLYLASVK